MQGINKHPLLPLFDKQPSSPSQKAITFLRWKRRTRKTWEIQQKLMESLHPRKMNPIEPPNRTQMTTVLIAKRPYVGRVKAKNRGQTGSRLKMMVWFR